MAKVYFFTRELFLSSKCFILKLNYFFIQFEEAAKEVADEVTAPRPEGEEQVEEIQIKLTSASNPADVRNLQVKYP